MFGRLVGPKEAVGCNRGLLAVLRSEPFCVEKVEKRRCKQFRSKKSGNKFGIKL